jgi:hypothetical protein
MNDDLKDKLKGWHVESPPSDLSNRIVMLALQHKQITPWSIRFSRVVDTAFSDWSYGLAYKIASFVLIVATGLTLGIATPHGDSETIDIVSLALGNKQAEES